MIIETKRAAFDPIIMPLTQVGSGATKVGSVIDFDAKNQMVETNEVLEIYLPEGATSAGVPTLQVKVETSEDGSTEWVVVALGQTFALAGLTKGAVLYKAALPDQCKQFVRVSLVNAVAATFTGGSITGVVRPL